MHLMIAAALFLPRRLPLFLLTVTAFVWDLDLYDQVLFNPLWGCVTDD